MSRALPHAALARASLRARRGTVDWAYAEELGWSAEVFATYARPAGWACALRPSIESNPRGDPSDSPRRGCAPTDPAGFGEAADDLGRRWGVADGAKAASLRGPCFARRGRIGRSSLLDDSCLTGDSAGSRLVGCAATTLAFTNEAASDFRPGRGAGFRQLRS